MGDEEKRSRVLRGAIVGFGNAALHAHLPVLQHSNQFRIDAVVEPDAQRAARAKELLPQASIYDDIMPLIARGGIDFVDICTPSYLHADLIEKSFSAGFHVLCEKPLVTSLESLVRIESVKPGQ